MIDGISAYLLHFVYLEFNYNLIVSILLEAFIASITVTDVTKIENWG